MAGMLEPSKIIINHIIKVMRSKLASLLGIFTMGMLGSPHRQRVPTIKKPLPPPAREEINLAKQMTSRGMTLFNIDGKEVWAINEKNAIRKAAKV